LHLSSQDIKKFKLFTEGVVFLMKRKINEGVDNFNSLKEQYALGPYFSKLFYIYRAFGYFMQNRHQEAIEDYKTAEQFVPKDKQISYNQLLAEGIVLVKGRKFEAALKKFDEAQVVISQTGAEKIEPLIYRAMTFAEKTKAALKVRLAVFRTSFRHWRTSSWR
jgi:tetratricopeptide (TPR) repeat protein